MNYPALKGWASCFNEQRAIPAQYIYGSIEVLIYDQAAPGAAGRVAAETIQRYIEEHKNV